jgi:YidC/Oxa1 family membrane protein insertase
VDKLPLMSQLIGLLTDLLMLLTGILHSYGLAIIVFTILVRGALAPLNLRQLHSAKKLSDLAPKIKQLQQQYKGDREALTRAQMALYKEVGVNPAAGCLPLLIQMPVLYALFFVFQRLARTPAHQTATAIYHQKFLWFYLDKPDSLFGHFFLGPHSYWGPLPILAALAQWVQQRMMMQPTGDPQQRATQQIMQFMPLLILVFATNYPAGLALYWVTSTCFSIVMQYFITGWGQLFKNPLQVPEAAAPTSRPTPSPPSPRPTRPGPRDNGQGPERARASSPTRRALARRPSTPAAGRGRGTGAEDTGPARRGKRQRAARRSKVRARSSRGAKR